MTKPKIVLTNSEDKKVEAHVDNNGGPWEGSKIYYHGSKMVVTDGVYTFADGRRFEVKDGIIQNFRTYMEVKLEESVTHLSEKIDALTDVLLQFTQAIQEK